MSDSPPNRPIPRPSPTTTNIESPDASIEAVLQDLPEIGAIEQSDPTAPQLDLGSSIQAVSEVHSRLQQRLSDLSH